MQATRIAAISLVSLAILTSSVKARQNKPESTQPRHQRDGRTGPEADIDCDDLRARPSRLRWVPAQLPAQRDQGTSRSERQLKTPKSGTHTLPPPAEFRRTRRSNHGRS